jgi:hypothetical protein
MKGGEAKMKAELLKSSIDMLKSVRFELHGNVENSVLEMLDKAISDLESFQQAPEEISADEVLHFLGQVLEKLGRDEYWKGNKTLPRTEKHAAI